MNQVMHTFLFELNDGKKKRKKSGHKKNETAQHFLEIFLIIIMMMMMDTHHTHTHTLFQFCYANINRSMNSEIWIFLRNK